MGVIVTAVGSTFDGPPRRLLDRAPSGRLYLAQHNNSTQTTSVWYSDNNGGTWAVLTGGAITSSFGNPTLFVDADGGVNLVNVSNAGIYNYRRGTVTGNTVTWGSVYALPQAFVAGDMVVFRNPNGPGYQAAFAGRITDGDNPHAFVRATVTPEGVGTLAGLFYLTNWAQGGSPTLRGGLDFHHTGDGKTVQGGTPHVYYTFADSFNRLWHNRVYWNGGALIPSGIHYIDALSTGFSFPFFDGTRTVILTYSPINSNAVRLYERDAGNTATISRGDSPDLANGIHSQPSASYDRDGNVYVYARQSTTLDMFYIKWTRATLTWGSWTLVTAANSTAGSLLRIGYAQTGFPTIEGVHADNGNLVYQNVLIINAVPFAPAITNPIDGSVADVNASLGIAWTFNDQDPGDAQTAYTVRRRWGANFTYWDGAAWSNVESASTKIVSATTMLSLASGWAADSDLNISFAVKTWDALNQVSPWSAEARVIPSVKDNPLISFPASDGASVTSPSLEIAWTVATQTKYRVRVVDDAGGSPNPGIVDYDSGIVLSSAARVHTALFPVNSETRQIELTTWNDEGLQSNTVYRIVNVSYTPPSTPTVALSTSAVPGAIRATITNPAGGATKSYNDVWRRIVGETSDGIRVAANVDIGGVFTDYAVASGVPYQYRIRTFADTGATADGAWTT